MTAEDIWMFNPDRAIKNSSEDKLNRKEFAHFIGKAILENKTKESLVIGILGKWGSGKSSIVNMAIEHMEYLSASNKSIKKPIIVHFNPWNFSGQNQLIYQFFNEFSIKLNMPRNSVKLKNAGNSSKILGKIASIGTLIPPYSSAASLGSAALNSAGEAAESLGDLFAQDLSKIKKEISDNLEKQNRKIIIVIDDIDRLNDREIRQIFQLVKSLADFPNTIYLLAFDRNVVVKAIEKDSFANGEEYLEKIIQIPIEIPMISKHELESYLIKYLQQLFAKYPDDQFDNIYWGNIYESGFKYFFKNIRDITRYINILNFYFEQVKNEVNVFDFCAITAVQLFIPNVYQGIRENKAVFAGIKSTSESDRVTYKEICDSIIKSSSEDTQIFLKRFLTQLFPKLNSYYESMFYHGDSYHLWKKRRRISSEDFFERYFKFSLADKEISQKDITFVLACVNDYDKLSTKLLELNYSNKILSFLTFFPDHIDKIRGSIELFVTALLDLGDLFPRHNSSISETDIRINYCLECLLNKLESQEERFSILRSSLERETRSIYTVVYEVARFQKNYDDTKDNVPMEKLILNSDQLKALTDIAKKKIEILAKKGKLEESIEIPYILYMWEQWGAEKKDIDNVISRILTCDSKLINFLSYCVHMRVSSCVTDYVSDTHYSINFKEIEKFMDLTSVESKIKKICSSGGLENRTEREIRAITLFLENYSAYKSTPHDTDSNLSLTV